MFLIPNLPFEICGLIKYEALLKWWNVKALEIVLEIQSLEGRKFLFREIHPLVDTHEY